MLESPIVKQIPKIQLRFLLMLDFFFNVGPYIKRTSETQQTNKIIKLNFECGSRNLRPNNVVIICTCFLSFSFFPLFSSNFCIYCCLYQYRLQDQYPKYLMDDRYFGREDLISKFWIPSQLASTEKLASYCSTEHECIYYLKIIRKNKDLFSLTF